MQSNGKQTGRSYAVRYLPYACSSGQDAETVPGVPLEVVQTECRKRRIFALLMGPNGSVAGVVTPDGAHDLDATEEGPDCQG